MVLAIFLIFSIPIGIFTAWFGWKAHKLGRTSIVKAMAMISFLSFSSAVLAAGWGYLFVNS